MMEPPTIPHERNFSVLLRSSQPTNQAWLESQAINLEETLIAECAGKILGPSVTANFEQNGFELDFTVEASQPSEAYDKLGMVLDVVERVAGINIEADSDQIVSDWAAPGQTHEHEPFVPA